MDKSCTELGSAVNSFFDEGKSEAIKYIFRASHCDKHQFHAKMMVKGKLHFCYHKRFPLTVFCEAFNQL